MMMIITMKKLKKFYCRIYEIVSLKQKETNCYYDNYNFLKCLDRVFKKEKDNFRREIPLKPFKLLVIFLSEKTPDYVFMEIFD